jgi:hypothetical protein
MLTIDIARSRNETRIIRMIQRIAMLEAEVERLRSMRTRSREPDVGEGGEQGARPEQGED